MKHSLFASLAVLLLLGGCDDGSGKQDKSDLDRDDLLVVSDLLTDLEWDAEETVQDTVEEKGRSLRGGLVPLSGSVQSGARELRGALKPAGSSLSQGGTFTLSHGL